MSLSEILSFTETAFGASISCVHLLIYMYIRYSSRASLKLNPHIRTCLGKFAIKLACSLRAVRVHLAHVSAFIVRKSWTSALNARERCTSTFNAC